MTSTTGEGRVQDPDAPEQRSIPQDTFAGRLMLARLHAGGLTIQDAAARCGLLNQSWSNWEKGMKPRDLLDVVNAISDGLRIDRDWLLFGGPLAAPESRRSRATGTPKGRVREAIERYLHVPEVSTSSTRRPRDTRSAGHPVRPFDQSHDAGAMIATRRTTRIPRSRRGYAD